MRIAWAGLLSALLLGACGGSGGERGPAAETPVGLRHSRLLRLSQGPGYVRAEVVNPWDTTRLLRTYILESPDSRWQDDERGVTRVKVPLANALVAPSAHIRLASDLGAAPSVGGVLDARFVVDSLGKARLRAGLTKACGDNANPDIEKVIALGPDAILLSPYAAKTDYGRIASLGVPVVECADYMECSPLARAEWVKFYGLLFGRESVADSLFSAVEARYDSLRRIATGLQTRPKVIFDMRYGQSWHVPLRQSTTGHLIEDAGAVNPFAHLPGTGSAPLSPEQVLATAHDADVWLVRYNRPRALTLADMKAEAPVNARFRAWKHRRVYGCNTAVSDLFDTGAFHPDLVLESMIHCLHPELDSKPESKIRFYSPLDP